MKMPDENLTGVTLASENPSKDFSDMTPASENPTEDFTTGKQ